jgi:hypothetical protein
MSAFLYFVPGFVTGVVVAFFAAQKAFAEGELCHCTDSKYPHRHDARGVYGDEIPQSDNVEALRADLIETIQCLADACPLGWIAAQDMNEAQTWEKRAAALIAKHGEGEK